MKKTIAILLVLCLCVGLCACTESTGASERKSSTDQNISDSNGYSSKEEFVDAYFNMFYVEVVSKKEYKKMFPKQLLEYYGYGEDYITKSYEQYVEAAEKGINNTKERLGDNYQLSWEIVDVEDSTNYREYTEEERQECLDMFGVEPENYHMYTLTVSITGTGKNGEFTNPGGMVIARKIAGRWYIY